MTTKITLTSGEKVQAQKIDSNHYRLSGGRVVRTWTDEDGTIYQDSESDDDDDDGPVVARCVEDGCTCLDRARVTYASRREVPTGYVID